MDLLNSIFPPDKEKNIVAWKLNNDLSCTEVKLLIGLFLSTKKRH